MDWDWQQQFVTPLSTPTNANFDCNQHVNIANSHFQDAFSSHVHQNPPQHQKHSSVDSAYVPSYSQPASQQQLQQQQQQHHHPHQHQQPQHQQSQHGQPQHHQHQQQQYQAYVPGPAFDTFQMQTPPPTRGSSIKRRPQRVENVAPTHDQGVLRQPEFSFLASQQPCASWSQPSAAVPPPTAPVWPVFAEDPFSQWQQANAPPNLPPQSSDPLPSRPTIVRSTSQVSLSYPTPLTAKKASVTSSVDPSLLYTSPGRPVSRDSNPRQPSNEPPRVAVNYASRSGSPTKLGLQRSNTTGGLRPSPAIVSSSPAAPSFLTRSNSAVNLPRRSSPLKRGTRGSLSSISETLKPQLRTSVVLTIDANGTARTETRVIEESPTKPISEKYSSLWEDSDSDSDSGVSRKWPSRNSSLAQSRSSQERQTKVAKLDPPIETLPRSNSTTSLRTPSKPSYTASTQIRRQSSVKKPQRPTMQSRRNTLSSLNSSFENLATMDLNADEKHGKNDAGSALRQVVANRIPQPGMSSHSSEQVARSDFVKPAPSQPQLQPQSQQPQLPPPPPPVHNTRSHTKSQSFSYPQQTVKAPTYDPATSFPMDQAQMNYAQAPGMFPSDLSSLTRCICAIPFDDGHMVQCGLCAMWSHTGCIGLDPSQHHSSYVCSFCINPVHPVRSSSMQNFNTWAVSGM